MSPLGLGKEGPPGSADLVAGYFIKRSQKKMALRDGQDDFERYLTDF